MQQPPPQGQVQGQVEYASLGLRVAAVVVDTLVLFGVYLIVGTVWALGLISRQSIDPQDSAAVQALLNQQVRDVSSSTFYLVLFGSLFIYHLLLEAVFSASIGKLVLGLRVVMTDGSRATGPALVMRNLVRIPEAMFLYVPAAISCTVSSRRQRLGDLIAHTTVVRRPPRGAVVHGAPSPSPPLRRKGGPRPSAQAGEAAVPAPPREPKAESAAPAPGPNPAEMVAPPSLDTALARLKTAALAALGAHRTYLHFSERELAAGDQGAAGYSEGYVSSWFTLTAAVAALRDARDEYVRAAGEAGEAPEHSAVSQQDLAHLLDELAPYFVAATDDEIHAAFLEVARAESASS